MGNAGGKGASLEKADASQAVVAKPMVRTKRRVPCVLEQLTAQGEDASVAEGDKSLTDGVAPKAIESSGAGDISEVGKGQARDISKIDPVGLEVA